MCIATQGSTYLNLSVMLHDIVPDEEPDILVKLYIRLERCIPDLMVIFGTPYLICVGLTIMLSRIATKHLMCYCRVYTLPLKRNGQCL